jgi:hypothetical protein
MDNSPHKSGATGLSDSQFAECLKLALHFLETNPSIRNRDIRTLSGIGYDQAIHFIIALSRSGIWLGKAAATRLDTSFAMKWHSRRFWHYTESVSKTLIGPVNMADV